MVAMAKYPEFFADVKAFVCPQPCSMAVSRQRVMDDMGIGEYLPELDSAQQLLGGFSNAQMSPHPYAAKVLVPTLIIQVREDIWTRPEDVQTTYDLIRAEQKQLFWVEGTQKRFDGYNYFGEQPQMMLEFFQRYMG